LCLEDCGRGRFVFEGDLDLIHHCVADLVAVKAEREPRRTPHKNQRIGMGKGKVVGMVVREVKGGNLKREGNGGNEADGGITYYKRVNVVFARMAVARLVAPASPIWLL
jgi:hypothetical protein